MAKLTFAENRDYIKGKWECVGGARKKDSKKYYIYKQKFHEGFWKFRCIYAFMPDDGTTGYFLTLEKDEETLELDEIITLFWRLPVSVGTADDTTVEEEANSIVQVLTTKYEACCNTMLQALDAKTAVIVEGKLLEIETKITMPPIKFCPWCGRKVRAAVVDNRT